MARGAALALLVWVAAPDSAEMLRLDNPYSASNSEAAEIVPEAARRESSSPPRISDEPPLPLEQVLADIGQSRQAVAGVSVMAAVVSQRLGRPVSAAELARRTKDPRAVRELFSVCVRDLVEGFAAARSVVGSEGSAASENPFRLPKRVALREAPAYFDADPWEPEQLHQNLYRYAIPSGISAQEVKTRTAFGEILDRLALNPSMAAEDQFRVVYRGVDYSDFDAFVGAMVQSGHRISVGVSNEVADFFHLMVRKPDGTFREVQTDIRIRTGYFTSKGAEIIIPAVHSHLIFRFAGPDLNTAVEFYQGTHGTHFYPSVVVKGESWVGIRNSAIYKGDTALKALKASALYLDALQGISREDALFAGGYGQSGICNDSVAVIEMLLNGKATVYPLLVDKKRVLAYLDTLVKKRPTMAARYREIYEAVEQTPSDVTPNPTQPQRILDSIPYGPGPTPYTGFSDARRTFRVTFRPR